MRVLLINSVLGYGSTGKIVLDIAKEYEKRGDEVRIAYGRKVSGSEDEKKYGVRIGTGADILYHSFATRLADRHGLASKRATAAFLKWADEFNPDLLWLHNIHGYYINYELLFEWIKSRPEMQVKWTLHDCWTFTGHCAHFTYVKCDKWKTGCEKCPQSDGYPKSSRDNSSDNYRRKKASFTGVKNLTIIAPSNWLRELLGKSFLSEYPVEVVYNTINKEVFKPTESSFKADYGLPDKKVILGVASVWSDRKGLNDFIKLSTLIDSDAYRIVLVGLNKKQIESINKAAPNIVALPRTSSAHELAKIYSAADVFVNPTYEDTFPTVNMEAEACGTPVITYDTGGCRETIKGETSSVVAQDINAVYEIIREL